ncbi:MAG TPA: hypothetical protein VIJ14_08125 [Rhabdochlamydiaceae bacterium]
MNFIKLANEMFEKEAAKADREEKQKPSTSVEVTHLPKCDFCEERANYDARTTTGVWANMCAPHYKRHGLGLGMGVGQKLILVTEDCPREKLKA